MHGDVQRLSLGKLFIGKPFFGSGQTDYYPTNNTLTNGVVGRTMRFFLVVGSSPTSTII